MIKKHFSSLQDWTEACVVQIMESLRNDINRRGHTVLAVPGGRTANCILPVLAKVDLDWSRMTITLTDERWVKPEHKDSNERLVRNLLAPVLNRAKFIGLKTLHDSPDESLAESETHFNDILPFGCVLLGMGEDGHVASLFPGDMIKHETLQSTMRDDYPRVSLTPQALLNTSMVVLAVSGKEKCATLEQAFRLGPKTDLPVRHLLHQERTPVRLFTA